MAGLQPVLKKVATKLIKKFGRDVTHITVTEEEYNPDTGSSSSETSTTITGVLDKYSRRDYNDVIAVGDTPLLTVSEVKIDDKIVIDTKEYSVTLVEATPLENGIVVYQCNLRAIA